jgi:nitroreductase
MEFRDIIYVRWSVRSFTDQDVEDETFTKIFEAARMVPHGQIGSVGVIF